jgi:hypothetical protein
MTFKNLLFKYFDMKKNISQIFVILAQFSPKNPLYFFALDFVMLPWC